MILRVHWVHWDLAWRRLCLCGATIANLFSIAAYQITTNLAA